MFNKTDLMYTGKAKSLYKTDDPRQLLVEFRDDVTAFNGEQASRPH